MNSGLEMKSRDYLANLLEIEKNMSNNYSYAINEASSDDLYEEFLDMFINIKDMARDIYDVMVSKNWYTVEYVQETKVNQEAEKLTTKLENLSN